jgi:DNA invertase Pin-like site-specific DNA recombinase
MPTAYSYIRFSTSDQRLGSSEQRQEESPEPWCRANSYALDTTLRLKDPGRSGYHGDPVSKGAMGVFLDLVRQRKIERGSILLIEHLDRFTRQDVFTGMDLIS